MNQRGELSGRQRSLFLQLCSTNVPTGEQLRRQVAQHLNELRNEGRNDSFLPVDVADDLARNILQLLDDQTLNGDQMRLVEGLARYFVCNEDDHPDLGELLGLDDDLIVYNHVVVLLGRGHRL